MKFSTLQMIAVFCILAVGFMAAAPVVQMAEADEYVLTIPVVEVILCKKCGTGQKVTLLGTVDITIPHPEGEDHATSGILYVYTPGPDSCKRCEKSS